MTKDIPFCIGNGKRGNGCGYKGGESGDTCPKCNGMVLSARSLNQANKTASSWRLEDITTEANAVLKSFYPDFEIYKSPSNRLRIKSKYGNLQASVANHSGSLSCNYGKLGTGGTGAMAIGQLIRWIRNQTRLPLTSWEYWASSKIALCNDRTVELIKNSSYCNDKKTCCVLCSSKQVDDWWSLKGVVGPCCYLGQCKQEKTQ